MIQSVAVLPFETVSGDSADAYLAHGITDELTVTLAKIPGMRVAPRASVNPAGAMSALEVGRQRGVQAVLVGSLRRGGDRLRVSAELIDVRTGRQVWSDQFEEDRKDVFAVEDRITRAIVGALSAHLEAGIARAMEYFRQAVARDSEFVQAISGLADTYTVSAFYSYLPPAEGYGRGKALAQRALRLDSTRAEPNASLGYVALYFDWDWRQAEREFQRAIQLDSGYATAHQWYGNYLVAMNRPTEAVEELRRAESLDPLNRVTVAAVCWGLHMVRRDREAAAQCRKAIELDSTFALGRIWIGAPLIALGDTAAAIRELELGVRLAGRTSVAVAALATAYAGAGRSREARALLPELESSSQRYVASYEIALVYAALHDADRAMAWLSRAYRERSHSMAFLNVDPALDPIRDDARFGTLVAKVGG